MRDVPTALQAFSLSNLTSIQHFSPQTHFDAVSDPPDPTAPGPWEMHQIPLPCQQAGLPCQQTGAPQQRAPSAFMSC